MKYKTFRLLVVFALFLMGGGFLAFQVSRCEPHRPVVTPPRIAPIDLPGAPASPVPPAAPVAAASPAEPGDHPLRDMDRAILARVEQNISGDKAKDAMRGQPYKVNLYKDAGQSRVNRLKIDLDRDDRDDEKWTFEPDGRVKRQVSPADDERYTVEYRLEGEGWRLKK